jgi:hypothetical protein
MIAVAGFALSFGASGAYAACSNPAGVEGEQIYNTTHNVMQFCDNTDWTAMRGDGDTLSALSCTDGQIAKWNNGGSTWECAADATGSGGDDLGNHIATTLLRSDTHNTDDLGTTAIRWKDGWFQGTVTGGTFAGSGASLTALNASQLSSGTIPAARIGNSSIVATTKLSATGTKNSTTFLRGDNTWATIPSTGDDLGSGGTTAGTLYTSGGYVGKNTNHNLFFKSNDIIEFNVNSSKEMILNQTALDLQNKRIIDVADPTAAQDAATKAYVDTEISGINVNDADASTTNEIQNLSQVLTQGNNAGGTKITNLGAPSVNSDATTKAYVDGAISGINVDDADANATNEIQNLSQVLTQGNDAGGTIITNIGAPSVASDATTKAYVDGAISGINVDDADANATNEIQNLSQVLTQGNDAGGTIITNIGAPSANSDAATKSYVDTEISGISFTETDPEVASVANGQWCRGTGSAVTCDQSPPTGDNLGTHTASTDLNMSNNNITNAGTVRATYSSSANVIWATSSANNGRGIYGQNTNTGSGSNVGVEGSSNGSNGIGVKAFANGSSGTALSADAYGSTGRAVVGVAHASSGLNYGIYGWTNSTTGYAVHGFANGTSGVNYGVQGTSVSSSGYGVFCNASSNASGCGGNRAWTNTSDGRLKENITSLKEEDGLQAIMSLRPVYYNWKDKDEDTGKEIGFIAQEVEEVIPLLVGSSPNKTIEDKDGKKVEIKDVKSLSYATFVAPIVKSIQQLKQYFDDLSSNLKNVEISQKKLEEENLLLKAQINKLEEENLEIIKRLEKLESE